MERFDVKIYVLTVTELDFFLSVFSKHGSSYERKENHSSRQRSLSPEDR